MRFIIGFIIALAIFGCSEPNRQNNEITKVELARSGAWSDYGATISVDTSFNYKYFGDHGNVKQGYFIGKIDIKFWDTLNQKLQKIHYKTLPITDNAHMVDVNYFELIVHWKNGKKRISRAWNWPSDTSVLKVIMWIDNSYQLVKLHQVRDSVQFETRYHKLPRPNISEVKFPPPVVKK
jgi:hypothetical protein